MATLAEIANQVNNTLTQIETNTKDTADVVALVKSDTADIKTRLDSLIGTTVAGFQFLGEGLYAIQELQREANAHLATQVSQNNVIICWLAIIADVVCKQLQLAKVGAAMDAKMLAALRTLEGVEKRAHAQEFVEYQHELQVEARLAACCPEATPYPEPCYQACPEPEVRSHDPRGQGWEPDFRPNPGGTTGPG